MKSINRIIIILSVLLLGLSHSAVLLGQSPASLVKGTVLSSNGETLIGAGIFVAGNPLGGGNI